MVGGGRGTGNFSWAAFNSPIGPIYVGFVNTLVDSTSQRHLWNWLVQECVGDWWCLIEDFQEFNVAHG